MKLPKKESALPEWRAAIETLMLVSRGGPTMLARIGVIKALNRKIHPLGQTETQEGPMTVPIYVNTSKHV